MADCCRRTTIEQIWATEMDFVVINRRNLMALSVVGPTALPKHYHQEQEQEQHPQQTLNMTTANGVSLEDEEDYYNDTMFTAMRGGMGAGNNNLFELRPQTEGRRKAAAKTTTTSSKATTKYTKLNAGKYFEVPDLINQDIDEEERQELEEAIHGDDDNTEDEEEIGVLDEDEEPEQGTVILPDFDEFVTKTTTTTTSSGSASASEDSNKLSIENWQTLGTLGKGRSTTTEEPTTSSTTTTTSTSTTPATTTTTTTTRATTTRGAAIATTSKQPQHHHHSKTRKHHKQHHKKQQQQQPPRRHHVASHEQAMLEREAVQEETTTRDSNIHRVRPEVLPEIIIPSTPVSSNSKIIAIKPKNQKRRISKRSAGVEIEPEYQLGDGAGSISSSEFVAKSNEEEAEESEDFDLEEGDFQSVPALTPATPAPPTTSPGNDYVRLDGFAGMLQLFFGIDKPIDVAIFAQPPSAEFVNLLCALLVWSVRYPAVFWNTSKSFACVFSLQMIVAALDIILGYVGVSNLYKLQIYAEAMPVHQPGLILNAIVTLALYLLATALVLASSMVMYLYGHGRLATRMRDRSIITLKANETWIYFAHCASLCFVLALAVVKAPLLNDLSATYKNNLHCPTFLAALIGVTHLLLWIVVWLCLTIKRRWHFKLPPLDNTYGGLLNKASAQPLLMSSGQRTGSNSSSGGNSTSTTMNGGNDSGSKPDMMSTATSTELGMGMGMGLAAQEDIYWPKLTPSSPKLKVTFNEVTSTSDDVLLIGDQEQTDGKRHTSRGASICFASAAGEIDDGEYATLRAATAGAVVGITMGSMKSGLGLGAAGACVGSAGGGSISSSSVGVSLLHLSEYDELPPPPPTNHQQQHQQQQQRQQQQQQQHHQHPHPQFAHGHPHDYANLSGLGGISDDNISEEGKLLACVRDDSITYASTRDLEPPQPTAAPPPPPPLPVKGAPMPQPPALLPHHGPFGRAPQAMPEIMQLSPEHHQKSHLQQHLQQPLQPQKPLPPPHHPLQQQQQQQGNPMHQHLVSPLAPVTVAVHTNEAHIASSSTPRCLRRADSGVPNEALTPRSDTTSITESTTTSPPERAPSESSSGVHSGEERELEVIIRPRASCKPPPRPPQPPIQEEPYGRCTNMRMSSFNADPAASLNPATGMNSATLPMQRTAPEQKFDYTAHCSTMPLPVGCHSQQLAGNTGNGGYASTSAMTTSMGGGIPPPPSQVTSFKTSGIGIHYANAAVALGNGQAMQAPHTTLPNGVRYSNPHFLRRLPHMTKAAESPYGHLGYGAGHHAFAKLPHETHPTIPEDRDSANYSMASDQDCGLYVTAQLH